MSINHQNKTSNMGNVVLTCLIFSILLIGLQILRKDSQIIMRTVQSEKIDLRSSEDHAVIKTSSSSQADSFYRTIKAGLQQPRDFPFQPQWSEETYDPEVTIDSTLLEKLKQHVLLRNFYSSNARLTPEFRMLNNLLVEWNIQPNPAILHRLFDSVRGTELLRESMVENQELVNTKTKQELMEMLQQDKIYLSRMVKEILGMESPGFIDALLEIRPKIGFGRPDNRIEPGERLLIQ